MKTVYKTSENHRKIALNYYYNHKEEIKQKNYINRDKISEYFKEYYKIKKSGIHIDRRKNKITKITNIPTNSDIVIFE